jgi:hypothetical protein
MAIRRPTMMRPESSFNLGKPQTESKSCRRFLERDEVDTTPEEICEREMQATSAKSLKSSKEFFQSSARELGRDFFR